MVCISEKNIAGVITTNYDTFLEDNFQGFTKFVGQSQLIFSAIQGIAEIYKIHGSVEYPDSIIINERDYSDFEKECIFGSKAYDYFYGVPHYIFGLFN